MEDPKVDNTAADKKSAKEDKLKTKAAPKKAKKQKGVAAGTIEVAKYKTHAKDTGSIGVQIAGLTENINTLSGHLQMHKKDFDSRRGLLKMVARRRRLLTALQSTDENSYQQLIADLGLRK